jgi:DNA replication and repair protein RecF
MIQFGAPAMRVRARVERGGLKRLYEVDIAPGSRKVRLDGKAPRPVARYFGDLNVVLFAPEDLHLPRGAPADRRRFLDRAVFNRRGEHLTVVADYDKALRSRNALLREAAAGRRPKGLADQLAVWDEQVAALGARLIAHRRAYLAELRGPVQAAFEAIARAGKPADIGYTTAPELAAAPDAQLPDALRKALAAAQPRDLARGSTSVGPHRDDLAFGFDGHDAAAVASQGQLRALVLAWKTAEIALLEQVHGEAPILLLDDVSSELDPARNRYLFEYLAQRPGQCFITTTHAGFVLLDQNRVDHQVRDGRIL